MAECADERRTVSDRRRVARGGRRTGDRCGAFPRVVFIDSVKATRELYTRFLRSRGFDVAPMDQGRKALAAIIENPPHLVITDLLVSELNGYQLIEELRQRLPRRVIPVLAYASAGVPHHPNQCVWPGVSLLSRPASLPVLLQEMRRLFQQYPPWEVDAGPCRLCSNSTEASVGGLALPCGAIVGNPTPDHLMRVLQGCVQRLADSMQVGDTAMAAVIARSVFRLGSSVSHVAARERQPHI